MTSFRFPPGDAMAQERPALPHAPPLLLVWIDDATVPDDSFLALFTALTGHAVPKQQHLEEGTTMINNLGALGAAGCAGGLADSMPACPHGG